MPVTAARSENMRRIRSKNTAPEMVVRRLLHNRGWRYRTHLKGLPGTPDIVFTSRKKAIFVHGCFWHGHAGCRLASLPKSRAEFWERKIRATQERDRKKEDALAAEGWSVLSIWQCQLSDTAKLLSKLENFLHAT
jgi:DNA mismatch endonuclease (patch repair protein)